MKIQLICVGRTRRDGIGEAFEEYIKRIPHYYPFELTIIPDIKATKSMTTEQQKQAEGRLILESIGRGDYVVLLDERGRELTSRELSEFFARKSVTLAGKLVLVIGGPFGFSDDVYKRADMQLALSRMTLPHDIARMLVAEQIYRAGTIDKGEPYHH